MKHVFMLNEIIKKKMSLAHVNYNTNLTPQKRTKKLKSSESDRIFDTSSFEAFALLPALAAPDSLLITKEAT